MEKWIAIYAAIVATGALALEVRRWFESRPRLFLHVGTNMMVISSDGNDEHNLTIVTVMNRGDAPTTITKLEVNEFASWCDRRRYRPNAVFLITNPQPIDARPNVPALLDAGSRWIGYIRPRPDLISDIQSGTMWVAVHTTDRDRPYLARVPPRRPLNTPEGTTEV